MHPLQQHAGHLLQTLRQGGQTLDGPSDGAVNNEQHLVHGLTALELQLDLSQTTLIRNERLKTKRHTFNMPCQRCSNMTDSTINEISEVQRVSLRMQAQRTDLRQWVLIIVPGKDVEKGNIKDLERPRHHLLSFPLGGVDGRC